MFIIHRNTTSLSGVITNSIVIAQVNCSDEDVAGMHKTLVRLAGVENYRNKLKNNSSEVEYTIKRIVCADLDTLEKVLNSQYDNVIDEMNNAIRMMNTNTKRTNKLNKDSLYTGLIAEFKVSNGMPFRLDDRIKTPTDSVIVTDPLLGLLDSQGNRLVYEEYDDYSKSSMCRTDQGSDQPIRRQRLVSERIDNDLS